MERREAWRVGHVSDPLAFVPRDRCSWSNRFDDPQRRWRTLYAGSLAQTCLYEALADLRPDPGEIGRFLEVFGRDAAEDLPKEQVTAAWRRQNVLAPAWLLLEGAIVDLTDVHQRHELEREHADLLSDNEIGHLDLHEITTKRRAVTQTIAADVHERLDAAAIRFPSTLDGRPCFAIFESRGELAARGDLVLLTDPAPEELTRVTEDWDLVLEPAAPLPSAR